ncbi:hypothetical protein [Aurantiacibacter gangjinensis]|uniref:Uncharacterized protein n=1 Tax=Aurantiacibacter gangjinensis TaxID=502682 RepID=A0A0G9MPF6_9SPHN|nr:hypothetical protein [Aurantiacibacter gangjinensis]APE29480.1 hypothetical protein BMF35_b0225 [Aurantiacibacter gangjinensis]KLE31143.1 hypothetical protein AAW01_13020 [Aurantiacibacter gangjinensis]
MTRYRAGMTTFLRILMLICLLPYAWVGWYWLDFWLLAETDNIDAQMLLNSFVLFCAAPFLIAFFAIVGSVRGAIALKDGLADRKPAQVVRNSGWLWLTVSIAVAATATSLQLYSIWFPDVPEGRDRLGRICETTETGSTRCRPDPDNTETFLDQVNRKIRDGEL